MLFDDFLVFDDIDAFLECRGKSAALQIIHWLVGNGAAGFDADVFYPRGTACTVLKYDDMVSQVGHVRLVAAQGDVPALGIQDGRGRSLAKGTALHQVVGGGIVTVRVECIDSCVGGGDTPTPSTS